MRIEEEPLLPHKAGGSRNHQNQSQKKSFDSLSYDNGSQKPQGRRHKVLNHSSQNYDIITGSQTLAMKQTPVK